MMNWDSDDVVQFLHDRGYSAAEGKMLSDHKVDGPKLVQLVKDPQLLSELKLQHIGARLIYDVKVYQRSGSNGIVFEYICSLYSSSLFADCVVLP